MTIQRCVKRGSIYILTTTYPHRSSIVLDEGTVPSNRSKSISVDGITLKNGHSVENGGGRWTSFKNSKLKPQYKTISPTSSVFYVHPDDLVFNKR